jgi:hypothetical protein
LTTFLQPQLLIGAADSRAAEQLALRRARKKKRSAAYFTDLVTGARNIV